MAGNLGCTQHLHGGPCANPLELWIRTRSTGDGRRLVDQPVNPASFTWPFKLGTAISTLPHRLAIVLVHNFWHARRPRTKPAPMLCGEDLGSPFHQLATQSQHFPCVLSRTSSSPRLRLPSSPGRFRCLSNPFGPFGSSSSFKGACQAPRPMGPPHGLWGFRGEEGSLALALALALPLPLSLSLALAF